jgi:hypothetical protein
MTTEGKKISLADVQQFISGASFQDMKEILLSILVWFRKHNLGNPFNYNRAFEFISALTHGFVLLPVGGGSDAVNPDDESDTIEIKTTKYELTKKGNEKSMGFTYNGTTRKPTLEEQKEYCYEKIMRDEYHIWDMIDYEKGALVKSIKIKNTEVWGLIWEKWKKSWYNTDAADPRIGGKVTTNDLKKNNVQYEVINH